MTEREALARIAALCDGFQADGHGDAVSVTSVRAILAEVTLGGDMQSPLTHPGDMQSFGSEIYRSGGVLDRDQARALVRPGVTLTAEEAALAAAALRLYDVRDATVNALAARLEAAS